MKYSRTFVELNKTIHDRASFDCGTVELNTFLQRHAFRHMKVGVSKTMVLPASPCIRIVVASTLKKCGDELVLHSDNGS